MRHSLFIYLVFAIDRSLLRSNLFAREAHAAADAVFHRRVRAQFGARSSGLPEVSDYVPSARDTAGQRGDRGLHRLRHRAPCPATSLAVDTRAPGVSEAVVRKAEGGGGRVRRY